MYIYVYLHVFMQTIVYLCIFYLCIYANLSPAQALSGDIVFLYIVVSLGSAKQIWCPFDSLVGFGLLFGFLQPSCGLSLAFFLASPIGVLVQHLELT